MRRPRHCPVFFWGSLLFSAFLFPFNQPMTSNNVSVSYRDYLESPAWHRLRQAKFDESGRFCVNCGSTEKLNVHHIRYRKRELTELSDLMVLCQDCHGNLHKAVKMIGLKLKSVGPDNVREVLVKFKDAGGKTAWREFKRKLREDRIARVGKIPPTPPTFRSQQKKLIKSWRKRGYTLDSATKALEELTKIIADERSKEEGVSDFVPVHDLS